MYTSAEESCRIQQQQQLRYIVHLCTHKTHTDTFIYVLASPHGTQSQLRVPLPLLLAFAVVPSRSRLAVLEML